MKKNLNKLLIVSLVGMIIITIICWMVIMFDDFNMFVITNKVLEEDVAVGMLLFPATFLADLGVAIFYLVMLFVFPSGALVIVFILQIIARLFQVGKEKKWKNITSKVFVYISLVLQILLCLYLFLMFISILNLILLLAIAGIITSIVLFVKEIKKMNKLKRI